MRTILDEVDPEELRKPFKNIFSELQRGKVLERMVFFEGCLSSNFWMERGNFSSKKIFSDSCLEKVSKKTGETTYYQQMLGAAIVHPRFQRGRSICSGIHR